MVENLEGEEWRPVVGWEKYYEVSNRGRVKSLERTIWKVWKYAGLTAHVHKEKILQPHLHKKYLQLELAVEKVRKKFVVHRLVAMAFHPNPMGLPEVDHLDTNKLNNRADNLEWVTQEENHRRAVLAGLMGEDGAYVLHGEDNPFHKLTTDQVREILSIGRKVPATVLASRYGVNADRIRDIIARRAWRHLDVPAVS